MSLSARLRSRSHCPSVSKTSSFVRIEDQRGHLRLIHVELVNQPLIGLPPEVPQPDLPLHVRGRGILPLLFRFFLFCAAAGSPSHVRQRKFPLRGPRSHRGVGFFVSVQSEPVREPGFPRSTVAHQQHFGVGVLDLLWRKGD